MKTTKLFCPVCGRCLGVSTSSDDNSIDKVLIREPAITKKKQLIHQMKCIKCKNQVYISLEFTD